MKKGIFLLILFFAGNGFSCAENESERQIANIEAFAQTYGLVRWFYPGDEAQQVDWNKLAAYGVSQVADCSSSEELKQKLEEIFTPIALGIRFSDSARYDALNAITPPDTTAMAVVAWQHYGVDLGLWSNIYASKRTNRALHTGNVSKLAIEGSLPAAGFIGSEVTVSADIKNDTPYDLDVFFRVAVNDSGPKDYVSFCVADSSLKLIHNFGEWQTYSRTVKVNSEHVNSLIRCGIYTNGEGRFSVRNISVTPSGKGEYTEYWNPVLYDYAASKSMNEISTRKVLFDGHARFGDVATRELAPDLYVHIPLVLYGTAEQTYPACDSNALVRLQKEIAKTELSDQDMMAADIIVAWNVCNYFHPYLSEQQVVWSEELSKALERSFESETYRSRPLKRMMACLNDAHIQVNIPKEDTPNAVKYLPFRVSKIDNKLVIPHSLDSQLQPGDVIESVDGADATAGYRFFEEEISGSPQCKTMKAEPLWLRSFGKQDEVSVSIRRGEQKLDITVSPMERDTYLRAMKSTYFGGESHWIDKNTLYLNLGNTDFATVSDFLKNRNEDQTVIMDIRNGIQFHFFNLLSLISKPKDMIPMRWGISHIPHVIYPEALVIADTLANVTIKSPNKRNIFLTGPANYSHQEEMLDYIRYAGMGYFIGTNTGGCNGRLNIILLPSGGEVSFTGTKVFSNLGPDGYYYGSGIKPDLYVEETIDDIIHGRDAAFEKAVGMSKRIISGK